MKYTYNENKNGYESYFESNLYTIHTTKTGAIKSITVSKKDKKNDLHITLSPNSPEYTIAIKMLIKYKFENNL